MNRSAHCVKLLVGVGEEYKKPPGERHHFRIKMPGEKGKHSQIMSSELACHTVRIVPQYIVLGQGSAFSQEQVAIFFEGLAGEY